MGNKHTRQNYCPMPKNVMATHVSEAAASSIFRVGKTRGANGWRQVPPNPRRHVPRDCKCWSLQPCESHTAQTNRLPDKVRDTDSTAVLCRAGPDFCRLAALAALRSVFLTSCNNAKHKTSPYKNNFRLCSGYWTCSRMVCKIHGVETYQQVAV